MFGFFEDAYVGGMVGDGVANVSEGEYGVGEFVISCWIESVVDDGLLVVSLE